MIYNINIKNVLHVFPLINTLVVFCSGENVSIIIYLNALSFPLNLFEFLSRRSILYIKHCQCICIWSFIWYASTGSVELSTKRLCCKQITFMDWWTWAYWWQWSNDQFSLRVERVRTYYIVSAFFCSVFAGEGQYSTFVKFFFQHKSQNRTTTLSCVKENSNFKGKNSLSVRNFGLFSCSANKFSNSSTD